MRSASRLALSVWLLAAVLATAAEPAPAPAANAAVVVHPGVQVSEMSPRSIIEVFTARRQRWADRSLVTVVLVTADEPLHKSFCDEVLGMSPEDLEAEQMEKQYRGVLQVKLIKVRTAKEALDTVAKTPGAIGYVRAPTDATVKVVRSLTLKGLH